MTHLIASNVSHLENRSIFPRLGFSGTGVQWVTLQSHVIGPSEQLSMSPPQVSRKREIPAQLSEPKAKRPAIPSLLTGLYDFAPLELQPPQSKLAAGQAMSTIRVHASAISAFHSGISGLPIGKLPII